MTTKKLSIKEWGDKPAPPPGPHPTGLRVLTKEEIARKRVKRKSGELKEDPGPELLPADSDRKRERIYLTLDPNAIAIARRIGNGVASRGVDRALFHFTECKTKRVKANANDARS